ncbi:MAG: hypothetical protein OHK0053_07350 [Microscillaceae bacterium]
MSQRQEGQIPAKKIPFFTVGKRQKRAIKEDDQPRDSTWPVVFVDAKIKES